MSISPSFNTDIQRNTISENTDYSPMIRCFEEVIDEWDRCGRHITLALLRPSLGGPANKLMLDDQECCDFIEKNISGLGIVTKFSFVFDASLLGEFYKDAREIMLGMPPYESSYRTRWDEFAALMQSGPTTCILLYSDEPNAVNVWREQVGHWNIEDSPSQGTIRGSLGVSNVNDLVHGSDSAENALREISLIHGHLRRGAHVAQLAQQSISAQKPSLGSK